MISWIQENYELVTPFVGPILTVIILPLVIKFFRLIVNSEIGLNKIDNIILIILIIIPIYTLIKVINYIIFYQLYSIDKIGYDITSLLWPITSFAIILIAFLNVLNYISLVNQFTLYKELEELKYKFALRNLKSLTSNSAKMGDTYYYPEKEGFFRVNVNEKFCQRYEGFNSLYLDDNGKYFNLVQLIRNSPIRSWFSINGLWWSLFGLSPILLYASFIFLIFKIESYILSMIFGSLIYFYTLIVQALINRNITNENKEFKSNYIRRRNIKWYRNN